MTSTHIINARKKWSRAWCRVSHGHEAPPVMRSHTFHAGASIWFWAINELKLASDSRMQKGYAPYLLNY